VPNELHLNQYKKQGPATPLHYSIYFHLYMYIMRWIQTLLHSLRLIIFITNIKFLSKLFVVKYYYFLLKKPTRRHVIPYLGRLTRCAAIQTDHDFSLDNFVVDRIKNLSTLTAIASVTATPPYINNIAFFNKNLQRYRRKQFTISTKRRFRRNKLSFTFIKKFCRNKVSFPFIKKTFRFHKTSSRTVRLLTKFTKNYKSFIAVEAFYKKFFKSYYFNFLKQKNFIKLLKFFAAKNLQLNNEKRLYANFFYKFMFIVFYQNFFVRALKKNLFRQLIRLSTNSNKYLNSFRKIFFLGNYSNYFIKNFTERPLVKNLLRPKLLKHKFNKKRPNFLSYIKRFKKKVKYTGTKYAPNEKNFSFIYYYYTILCYKLFSTHLLLVRKNLLYTGHKTLYQVKKLYKKIRFLRNKLALYDMLFLSNIVVTHASIFFILNYIGWQIHRKSFHTGFLKYFFIIFRLLFYTSGIIYGIKAVLSGPYNRHSRTKALIWKIGHDLKNNTSLKKTMYDIAIYDLQYGSIAFHFWVDYLLPPPSFKPL
jgi:hypothetical protein